MTPSEPDLVERVLEAFAAWQRVKALEAKWKLQSEQIVELAVDLLTNEKYKHFDMREVAKLIETIAHERWYRSDELRAAITSVENVLRGNGLTAIQLRSQTCKRGHPYDRIVIKPNDKKHRLCSTCRKEKAWKKKNAVA